MFQEYYNAGYFDALDDVLGCIRASPNDFIDIYILLEEISDLRRMQETTVK